METPSFLTIEDVLAIHRDQIEHYGGSPVIRDTGLLASAVAAPAATFGGQFLNADLFEMAATYLVGLVLDHPFEDGNKRVGTVAALLFLLDNGIEIRADEPAFSDMVIAVTEGEVDKSTVAQFLRDHAE